MSCLILHCIVSIALLFALIAELVVDLFQTETKRGMDEEIIISRGRRPRIKNPNQLLYL